MTITPPHAMSGPALPHRHGHFWIEGDSISTPAGTVQRGQMYVEWLVPEVVTQPLPLVLIHGGGGQGTDWLGTPDGREGWAYRFVREGFAVYVVDRPGHGRSPYHPEVLGGAGPIMSWELAQFLFAGPHMGATQTKWPWSRDIGAPELGQVVASSGFVLADAAEGQRLDGIGLTELLDLVGPAVLVTHSAGAPAGWLAANQRPDLVKAIVALEPMGPPFAELPGFGKLAWGITLSPLELTPPTSEPADLQDGLGGRTVNGLNKLPIAVVVATDSPAAGFGAPTVSFLREAGANAELMPLSEHGIVGNGHGFIYEVNSDETVAPVVAWITSAVAEGVGVVLEGARDVPENPTILVARAVTELFINKDVLALDRYWGPSYIQHNPHAPNGTEVLREFVSDPGNQLTYEMGMVIGEGEFVAVQGRYSGIAPRPIVAIDIFRVQGGRIVEHWDVVQDESSETTSGNPMFTPAGLNQPASWR